MNIALYQKIAVILVSHKRLQIIGGIERMIELLFSKLVTSGIPTSVVYRELFNVGVIQGDKKCELQEVRGKVFLNKTPFARTFKPPEFLGLMAEFSFSFLAALKIISLVKKYRMRRYVVIVHAMDTVFGGLAAFLASKLVGTPYITHTHGIRTYFTYTVTKSVLVRQIDFLVEKIVIHHARKLISVNNEARKFWIERGIPKEKIALVPVFIETELFSPSEFTRNVVRKELGISNDSVVFGYIGRLSPEKNLLTLVKAFHLANFDAKLVIVGDGPLFSFLKHYVKNEGLGNKVIFTGFRNDIHRIINAIDVLVLPSFIEGLPTVLIEACANEKPIIASNIPSIRELIQNEGILFNPQDVDQLKNALLLLYKNMELRKRLGRSAKKKAEQYNINAIFKKIIHEYVDALSEFVR